jgi:hypothetical protein
LWLVLDQRVELFNRLCYTDKKVVGVFVPFSCADSLLT